VATSKKLKKPSKAIKAKPAKAIKAKASSKNAVKKTAKKAVKKVVKKTAKKSETKDVKKIKTKASAAKAKPAVKVKTSQSVAATRAPKRTGDQWDNIFVPLDDRILVRVKAAAEKTAGGIYIPTSVESRPNQGEVLSVGRGHRDNKGRLRPLDVQIGDSVLFAEFAGAKTSILGEELLILREGEVLGVLA
jgi:chaperonin GroES